jgi:uncharacterized membrane protein
VSKKNSQQVSKHRSSLSVQAYQGPIPPSGELLAYENILPGSAERILKGSEEQRAHRIEMEKLVITGEITQRQRGQLFAFCIALVITVSGFALIMFGHDLKGFVAIIAAITSIAGLFVYSNKKRKDD